MSYRLYSNVNNRFRPFTSGARLQRAPTNILTGNDMAAIEANKDHLRLEGSDTDRQSRRHMLEVKEAAASVVHSKDKRRRPRKTSKKIFKKVRALKLTQTKRIKKKVR